MQSTHVKVYDPRGNQWLARPEYPAQWTKNQTAAVAFERERVIALRASWPFLEGCRMIDAQPPATPTLMTQNVLASDRELVIEEVIGWRAWNVYTLGKLVRLGSV